MGWGESICVFEGFLQKGLLPFGQLMDVSSAELDRNAEDDVEEKV